MRARLVAAWRSSLTLVEVWPKAIRSPAVPAMITSSCVSSSARDMIVWSRSESMWAAVPSWRPRATIESLRVEVAWPIASVTTAWEASWIEISQRSCSVRMCFLAGPATTRSIASSSVAWSICARPSRTLSSAASLITFASSAPLKPGVSRATSSSEASGPSGRLLAVQAQDLEAPVHVGHVDHDLPVEAARA